DTQIDLPDAQEERLDVVYRFERCLSPHSDTPEVQKISQIPMEWEDIPVQSSPIWTIAKPMDVYEDTTPDPEMGQKQANQDVDIPRRYLSCGVQQAPVRIIHRNDSAETGGTGISYQHGEIRSFTKTINSAFRDDYRLKETTAKGPKGQDKGPQKRSNPTVEEEGGTLAWTTNDEEIDGAQELLSQYKERMECRCQPKRTFCSELDMVEGQINDMERSLLYPQIPRSRNLYRCQRQRLGNSDWFSILFGNLEQDANGLSYKRERVINNWILSKASTSPGKMCVDIFGQHNINVIHAKDGWNSIREPAEDFRRYLETLFRYEDIPSDKLCTNVHQPRRCPVETDASNRIELINKLVRFFGEAMGTTRCGPLCYQLHQEGTSILQLVPGQVESGYRCPGSRLEAMGQRLLLYPLESDLPSTPTSTTGETNNDVSNSSLGVSHLVPNINQDDDNETMEDRSGGDYSGPKKRKISPLMQQEVVSLGMEDYQQFLQD
ncbi:hypothetical protein AYI70_g5400, partial [Smittium culicis]